MQTKPTMRGATNDKVVLASRPSGLPRPDDFRLERERLPAPGPGQVLLQVLVLSIDPYMRGRMDAGKSYAKPVEVGAAPGPDRLALAMRDVLKKSLLVRGFIQREFLHLRPAFLEQAQAWVRDGRLRYREEMVDGLENARQALIGLLQGRNFGKLLVKVAD